MLPLNLNWFKGWGTCKERKDKLGNYQGGTGAERERRQRVKEREAVPLF